MKHSALALALIALPASLFAQGPLSPTAAPAPTMKTLQQIEPRTPVDAAHTGSGGSAQFLITQPGSYYLTTNIISTGGQHGINISANNVSLDLNGFSMVGTSNSYDGIYIHSGYQNITVRNGIISGWGAGASAVGNPGAGIVCYANNAVFEHIIVSANTPSSGLDILASGCSVVDCTVSSNLGYGVYVLTNGTVRGCTVDANSGAGIFVGNDSAVFGSTVSDNLGDGLDASANCLVKDCIVNENDPYGISVLGHGCSVVDCTANGNLEFGISTANNCSVRDCTAGGNGQTGIVAGGNSTVIDCAAGGNVGIGIYIAGNNCLIAGNTCSSNATGVVIGGGQNRVDGNSVGGNSSYSIEPNFANVTNSITRNFAGQSGYGNYAGNNDYAPIQTPSTATSPWANF